MKATLFVMMGAALLSACGAGDDDAGSESLSQAVTQPADLRVSLTGPTAVPAGSTNAYQLLLRNTGQRTANSSIVIMPLPSGVALSSATTGCVANGPAEVRCTYGNVAAGASISRTINLVSPAVGGSVQLSATASTTSQESFVTNNSAALLVAVSPPPVPITLTLPQSMSIHACFDVTSYSQCVPAALTEDVIILNADYTITTGYPEFGGTWSQPAGPASLRLAFYEQGTGNPAMTYQGTGISSSCVEGTGSGPNAPPAAFQACTN